MSIDAMTWAMKHAPVKKTKTAVRNRMVLTYLADRYNDDTRACWPSLDLIARELDTSKTTVQRAVGELEEQGLISRTNPQIISYIPEYRRPTVWTLNLHLKRDVKGSNVGTVPNQGKGGSNVDQGRVPTSTTGGSNVDHLTQSEPKPEPKEKTIDHPPADRFDEFWAVVPRKVSKKKARTEWDKAIKDTDPSVIIEGMERYRNDPNRSDAFTKHPTTWLAQGCWDDDPLPSSSRTAPGMPAQSANTIDAWLGTSTTPSQPEINPVEENPFGPFIDHQEGF